MKITEISSGIITFFPSMAELCRELKCVRFSVIRAIKKNRPLIKKYKVEYYGKRKEK